MNSTICKKKLIETICGKDLSYAKGLIDKFGTNINEIEESNAKEFVLLLKKIIETNDENILDTLYKQYESEEYQKINPLLVEQELKEYFAEQLTSDLYELDEINKIANEELPDELKNIGVPVYDAGVDFRMLVSAQDTVGQEAYGDKYIDKWKNKSPFFCTSYIRNDMICTCKHSNIFNRLREGAVLFGFNNIASESITHMYPDDVFSVTDLGACDEKYLLPDTLVEETVNFSEKYSYNEIGFDKKQNGKIVEPDYFIVCKQNGKIDTDIDAIRNMVSEFGNKTPLVIIDVDKCLENESKKVYHMIDEFERTNSIEIKELIIQKFRNNILTARVFETTFFEINKFEEIETKLDNILEKRKDLRKNLEWKCKGQSLLSTLDLESEAISIGLDFDDEIKKSTSKVKFDSELDKYIFSKDDAYSTNIPEDKAEILKQEAEELGLDFEEECDNAIARIMFRDDLKRMYDGKKEHEELSLEIMEEQCESLGLCWNYEVYGIYDKDELPISSDTKKSVENIARKGLSRDVQKTSTEIKEGYKEIENSTQTRDDSVSLES